MAHRIAYDTALLEEFLAALPQRIAFWEHVRAKKTWSKLEHVPTIWDSQLDAYIERLRWVEEHSREATAHLNGHFRFHVVAVALKFGINSAIRYADGPARHFTEAITDDVLSADMELELLIYQQRSDTFQFKASPPLDTAQACESLTASK
jgi:hypothetical protein